MQRNKFIYDLDFGFWSLRVCECRAGQGVHCAHSWNNNDIYASISACVPATDCTYKSKSNTRFTRQAIRCFFSFLPFYSSISHRIVPHSMYGHDLILNNTQKYSSVQHRMSNTFSSDFYANTTIRIRGRPSIYYYDYSIFYWIARECMWELAHSASPGIATQNFFAAHLRSVLYTD